MYYHGSDSRLLMRWSWALLVGAWLWSVHLNHLQWRAVSFTLRGVIQYTMRKTDSSPGLESFFYAYHICFVNMIWVDLDLSSTHMDELSAILSTMWWVLNHLVKMLEFGPSSKDCNHIMLYLCYNVLLMDLFILKVILEYNREDNQRLPYNKVSKNMYLKLATRAFILFIFLHLLQANQKWAFSSVKFISFSAWLPLVCTFQQVLYTKSLDAKINIYWYIPVHVYHFEILPI